VSTRKKREIGCLNLRGIWGVVWVIACDGERGFIVCCWVEGVGRKQWQ